MRSEPPDPKRDGAIALALAAALASLYWLLHCPTFGPGDSPQHVLSALTWGVSEDIPQSDPTVARELARIAGAPFHFLRYDSDTLPSHAAERRFKKAIAVACRRVAISETYLCFSRRWSK